MGKSTPVLVIVQPVTLVLRQTQPEGSLTLTQTGTSALKRERKGGKKAFLRKRVKVRRLPALTHVQDVERDDIRGGPSQLVGRLHPDLVGREEVQVPGDAARVGLSVSVVLALLLLAIPPGRADNGGRGDAAHVTHTLFFNATCSWLGVNPALWFQ